MAKRKQVSTPNKTCTEYADHSFLDGKCQMCGDDMVRQSPLADNGCHDIRDIQSSIRYWHELAFGDDHVERTGRLIAEEVGELCRCIVKRGYGGRGETDWSAELVKEIGDVFISIAVLANGEGIDLQRAIEDRFYGEIQYRQGPDGQVPWATESR